MNQKNECRYYESCSSQLCPVLTDEENKNSIWFPDEVICRRRNGLPDWVKQQRKIAKKAKPENFWHYFTLEMLKVHFRVTSSIKGLDPNIDLEKEELQLKAWHKNQKGTSKMKLSEEQVKKKRLVAAKARQLKEQKHKPINKKAA